MATIATVAFHEDRQRKLLPDHPSSVGFPYWRDERPRHVYRKLDYFVIADALLASHDLRWRRSVYSAGVVSVICDLPLIADPRQDYSKDLGSRQTENFDSIAAIAI